VEGNRRLRLDLPLSEYCGSDTAEYLLAITCAKVTSAITVYSYSGLKEQRQCLWKKSRM
jgi:hypothetical protein